MKSHSDNLYQIIVGLIQDVRQAYPHMAGLDRDLERLASLQSERGLGTYTLDLPSRESALLRGLESGRLDTSGMLAYSKRVRVPRLFAGLYLRIFTRSGSLRLDADVNAIVFLRQILTIGKKIEVPCSRKRELKAIEEYVNVENILLRPNLRWGSDTLLDCPGDGLGLHLCDNLGPDLPLYPEYNIGRNAREQLLLQRCQQVADFVAEELGTFCPDCFIEANRAEGRGLGLRHGPGAVAERSGRFFDKHRFTNWSAKLSKLYPFDTTGRMPNDRERFVRNHEVPARLIMVPKTAKGPRIIAAEPSEHMYTQNVLAAWLVNRIRETWIGSFIDFKRQDLSGRLVLKASADQELATIDLSSASDRLSLWVVERMFRTNPSILNAIHATRTRWLKLPNGECIELKKFASQGTALTFPVQTLVFFCIALACSLDGPVDKSVYRQRLVNKVRVYGDDIVVPTTRYADTVVLLSALQLKVNQEKSFSRGHFRESCGVDAFKGYDVTPIKPKTTVSDDPASCQAILDTINNLFRKGFWNASERLRNRQPARNLSGYGLVGRDAGAEGVFSPSFDTYWKRVSSVMQCTFDMLVARNSRHSIDVCAPVKWGSIRALTRWQLREYRRSLPGEAIRWNTNLQRFEVRRRGVSSRARWSEFSCGYSGLLQRQLLPPIPDSRNARGLEGVPERPSLVTVRRWVALSDIVGE